MPIVYYGQIIPNLFLPKKDVISIYCIYVRLLDIPCGLPSIFALEVDSERLSGLPYCRGLCRQKMTVSRSSLTPFVRISPIGHGLTQRNVCAFSKMHRSGEAMLGE